jgi:hypothetical protein
MLSVYVPELFLFNETNVSDKLFASIFREELEAELSSVTFGNHLKDE